MLTLCMLGKGVGVSYKVLSLGSEGVEKLGPTAEIKRKSYE